MAADAAAEANDDSLQARQAILDRCERLWAAELARSRARCEALSVSLDVQRRENQRLRVELHDDAQAQVAAIELAYETSLSWRVTRPFRKVRRFFRHRSA